MRHRCPKAAGRSLSIQPARAPNRLQLDGRWLDDLLIENLPGAEGSLVLHPAVATSLAWDWPLQTGVLTAGGSPLGSRLETFRYRRFLELVDPTPSGTACELLLLTGTLAEAAQHALSTRLEASLVVVLGDKSDEWSETQALLQLLRGRLRAGAIVLQRRRCE